MIEEIILAKYNYWIYVVLMMIGFYAIIAKSNLVKKVIGLNIFSTAIFLYFISIGDIREIPGKVVTEPIYWHGAGADLVYVNPIPHVLILTGIVVSVSTTAVALALIIRIQEEFGTIEEDKILELEA